MIKKYIIVEDDSSKGFDKGVAILKKVWGAEEIEPCDDCISRQAVIDINEYYHGQMPNHVNHEIWKEIKALPSVTPQPFINKPCISEGVCREDKIQVLDKIIAEIDDEAEYAYADFDKYKEDILHAESDELPDDDFRYGLRRAIEIINKHKRESEEE